MIVRLHLFGQEGSGYEFFPFAKIAFHTLYHFFRHRHRNTTLCEDCDEGVTVKTTFFAPNHKYQPASYEISFYRSETFAEQSQHFVYLIHPQGLLPLFKVSYKPETHAGPLCQLNLRKPVSLSFLLNMFR